MTKIQKPGYHKSQRNRRGTGFGQKRKEQGNDTNTSTENDGQNTGEHSGHTKFSVSSKKRRPGFGKNYQKTLLTKKENFVNNEDNNEIPEEDSLEQSVENVVSPQEVLKATEAILKLLEKQNEKKNNLLPDDSKLYLKVACSKVPQTPERILRLILPHSIYEGPPDVCLFTSDLKKGRNQDPEPTIEYIKDFLREKGVTEISEIIPLSKLRTEYSSFYMKRALCHRFDAFLADGKASRLINHHLGKTFFKLRKIPVALHLFDGRDVKSAVKFALCKSPLYLSDKGNLFSLTVGNCHMPPKQIQENVLAAIRGIKNLFPGGLSNVAHIFLKGTSTPSVSIYLSMTGINAVKPVVCKPKHPRNAKSVEGLLDGVGLVEVKPDGGIIIKQREEEEDFEKEAILKAKEMKKKIESFKKQKRNAYDDSDDEDGSDEEGSDIQEEEEEIENENVEDEDSEKDDIENVTDEEYREDEDNEREEIKVKRTEALNFEDSKHNNNTNKYKKRKVTDLTSYESAYLMEWENKKTFEKIEKKKAKAAAI